MTNQLPESAGWQKDGWLTWSDGIGFHNREPIKYGDDYFSKYRDLDKTRMGVALTQARVNFVRKYTGAPVVDIGIGGGAFVEAIDGKGFDVSTSAVRWLLDNRRYCDPYSNECPVLTFWDSFEHIPAHAEILKNATGFVFVSMPVYVDRADCEVSKHFKPGEHHWYFSVEGLCRYLAGFGFTLLECNAIESELGRESIASFVFNRGGL